MILRYLKSVELCNYVTGRVNCLNMSRLDVHTFEMPCLTTYRHSFICIGVSSRCLIFPARGGGGSGWGG